MAKIQASIRGLGRSQQEGILSVLGAMGSLIGMFQRITPGSAPAAIAVDAIATAAFRASRPHSSQPPPQSQPRPQPTPHPT